MNQFISERQKIDTKGKARAVFPSTYPTHVLIPLLLSTFADSLTFLISRISTRGWSGWGCIAGKKLYLIPKTPEPISGERMDSNQDKQAAKADQAQKKRYVRTHLDAHILYSLRFEANPCLLFSFQRYTKVSFYRPRSGVVRWCFCYSLSISVN